MLLCGGDSFGRFSTPMGNGKQQEGYSAVELLIDKLNITGKEIAWPGASIDATVAKTIDYITKDNSIKFLIFYITANVRIMYSTKTTDDYHFADSGYDDPHFFNDQEIFNVHSNDGKGHTPDAFKYFLHQPTYKKYYDCYAYINFLSNVCEMRGINILYVRTTNKELDQQLLLNNSDHVRFINLGDLTKKIQSPVDIKSRGGNHLFPEEHEAFLEQILNLHESFILNSLQK
jgi:hypothetical protein